MERRSTTASLFGEGAAIGLERRIPVCWAGRNSSALFALLLGRGASDKSELRLFREQALRQGVAELPCTY